MLKQTDKELELFFKNARHEQKLTYEELAEKAEMSSRYLKETLAAKLQLAGYDFNDLAILRIEQGTRFVPDYEVVALAEVFNVSCENLLGLTDAPAK